MRVKTLLDLGDLAQPKQIHIPHFVFGTHIVVALALPSNRMGPKYKISIV